VWQRTADTFIANKIKDELLNPALSTEEEPDEAPAVARPASRYEDDPQDGSRYVDEDGNLLGYLRRVHDVAVYTVTTAQANANAALHDALSDPDSQVTYQTVNGRISAIIYAPDPERQQPVAEQDLSTRKGFRSNDV
jgi:hypothetical protein